MTANISIIGTGNVATVMAGLFHAHGHRVVEITGRQASAVDELAERFGAFGNVQPEVQPTLPADIYLIALSDSALNQLPPMTLGAAGLWVHTSGAVPMEVLAGVAERTGVFYPLQSLRKEKSRYVAIPLMLEAAKSEDLDVLIALAQSCKQEAKAVSAEQRLAYHLAAVFANNFTNHLLAEANLICRDHDLSFDHLMPLIQETVDRLQQFAPMQVQTGPALRGDTETMHRHLQLLASDGIAASLYQSISAAIAQRHGHEISVSGLGNMANI